jgi:hypothetical protein
VQDSNLRRHTPTDLQNVDPHAVTCRFAGFPSNFSTNSPRRAVASDFLLTTLTTPRGPREVLGLAIARPMTYVIAPTMGPRAARETCGRGWSVGRPPGPPRATDEWRCTRPHGQVVSEAAEERSGWGSSGGFEPFPPLKPELPRAADDVGGQGSGGGTTHTFRRTGCAESSLTLMCPTTQIGASVSRRPDGGPALRGGPRWNSHQHTGST